VLDSMWVRSLADHHRSLFLFLVSHSETNGTHNLAPQSRYRYLDFFDLSNGSFSAIPLSPLQLSFIFVVSQQWMIEFISTSTGSDQRQTINYPIFIPERRVISNVSLSSKMFISSQFISSLNLRYARFFSRNSAKRSRSLQDSVQSKAQEFVELIRLSSHRKQLRNI
jgi:hypothetical protein